MLLLLPPLLPPPPPQAEGHLTFGAGDIILHRTYTEKWNLFRSCPPPQLSGYIL